MPNIQVTNEAKEELSKVLSENADKSLRLFIQGAG